MYHALCAMLEMRFFAAGEPEDAYGEAERFAGKRFAEELLLFSAGKHSSPAGEPLCRETRSERAFALTFSLSAITIRICISWKNGRVRRRFSR